MDDNLPKEDYFSLSNVAAAAKGNGGSAGSEENVGTVNANNAGKNLGSVEDKLMSVLSELLGGDLEDLGLVLRLMGELLGAARVRVWRLSQDKTRLDLVETWVGEGIDDLSGDWKTLDNSSFPWLLKQMNQSQIVVVDDLEKMVEEAVSDKEMLQRQQLKNSLMIPFPVGYEIGGMIQADDLGQIKLWTNLKLMERLSLVAKGLGLVFKPNKNEELESMDTSGGEFKAIFESVDVGILVLNHEGVVKKVNSYAAEMFGKEILEMEGKPIEDLASMLSSDSVEVLHRNLGVLHMGSPLPPFAVEVGLPNGGIKVLEISASVLKQEDGSVGDLILVHDATIKKQVEQAVEESERRLRTVLESVKQGIMFSDEKGHFLIFNSEMEAITGFTMEEANAAANFYQLIHPHREGGAPAEDLSKMNIGEKRSGEVEIHTKSGLQKNVIVSTTVLSHEGKKMFLSAFHDVTDRKKAENELKTRNVELEKITSQLNETMVELQKARLSLEDKVREKTEELRRTLIQVEDLARFSSEDPFPVLRVSPGGQLRYANAASQVLLEAWKTNEGGMLPESWRTLVAEVFERNNRKIAEVELEKGIISFVMVPVRSGGYVNMYGRDVSREKEVERMKNEFISMVSHQVRTPLTSMRWYSEMLMKAKESLSQQQLEIAKTIHETSIQLAELVNDLLNISRMESGKLDFNPETGNLMNLVNGMIKELQMQAQRQGVQIQVAATELSDFVFDPKLVREIVMNLLSNAIKYSKENGVVAVKVTKQDKMVLIQVDDNGIGIPKDAQKDIFNRFYRAQNAVDADIDGTGLGLSVARMMAEKCGGKLWFESEPGVKTSFYFTLPLQIVTDDVDAEIK